MARGTGTDITAQEADDILHKLITEQIKVQASFSSGARVSAFVVGLVKITPEGTMAVSEHNEVGSAAIFFDPSMAISRRYGDNRAFSGAPSVPGAPRLSSALVFVLRDGSQLGLFEIAD